MLHMLLLPKSELVQLKLNIRCSYVVKYTSFIRDLQAMAEYFTGH